MNLVIGGQEDGMYTTAQLQAKKYEHLPYFITLPCRKKQQQINPQMP
jgi:hypothetical protein